MKRGLFLTTVLLLGLGVVAVASANVPNVANVSQQGSLLVFPKIDVSGDRDTIISISNGFSSPVQIECYYEDAEQNIQDFSFQLTSNQPVAFSARCGGVVDTGSSTPPFVSGNICVPLGELKCWAVSNDGTQQIRWNYLTGTAKVIDYKNYTAYEYNAWSFDVRPATIADGSPVGTPGNITLDGVNYDACPQYFLGNFFSSGSGGGFFKDTDLTLVPCKEDLREEHVPVITKALFDIWTGNESEYSGTWVCIRCWFESCLSKISSHFQYKSLETVAARFRTRGIASPTVCGVGTKRNPYSSQPSPLIGVIVEELDFTYGGLEKAPCSIATTASTGFGAGQDTDRKSVV